MRDVMGMFIYKYVCLIWLPVEAMLKGEFHCCPHHNVLLSDACCTGQALRLSGESGDWVAALMQTDCDIFAALHVRAVNVKVSGDCMSSVGDRLVIRAINPWPTQKGFPKTCLTVTAMCRWKSLCFGAPLATCLRFACVLRTACCRIPQNYAHQRITGSQMCTTMLLH